MAELNSSIITITENDLLRLNVTAAEIEYIFKTLANDPKIVGKDNQFLVINNSRQIEFKPFEDTGMPQAIGVRTGNETFYITQDTGEYTAGSTLDTNTTVLDIVKKMLRNYKDATEDNIKYPSITVTEVIATDGDNDFKVLEDHEFEIGTNIKFNSVIFKTFVGEYPWGPNTGVKFEGLRVDVDNETKLYPGSDDGDRDIDFNSTSNTNYDIQTLNNNTLSISNTNEKTYTFAVKSSHTKGANAAYGNDKHTVSTLSDESTPVYISASAEISGLKTFKIKGYYNSAYINTNDEDFRAGQMFKDLPETFINNGALRELHIAIKSDLGKTIKSITNKRTGMPQPFTKLESTSSIPAKAQGYAATYDIYKISNKLAESVANEEYQISYQDK